MVKSNWLADVDENLNRQIKKRRISREEQAKTQPELVGEQSYSGSAPDPELINETDTLEMAQAAGLYEENSEEDQDELDVAEEVDEAESDRRGIDKTDTKS